MAGEQELKLLIRVNSDTGQMEIVGTKLDEIGKKAGAAGGSFGKLSGEAGGLLKSFLPFATAGGIIAFFTSAVQGAEAQNESMRRLKFAVESAGQSWDRQKESVNQWADAVGQATRFSDGEALQTLERFVRVTGSVTQGQSASMLAMNLSVQSGRDLATTTGLVTDLLNGQERALIQLRREFGDIIGNAQTTEEALNRLSVATKDAAVSSKGLTDDSAKLSNEFGQFKDQIGNAFIPALMGVVHASSFVLKGFQAMATGLASLAAAATVPFGPGWKEGVVAAIQEGSDQIRQIWAKDTEILKTTEQERLTITAAARQIQKQKRDEERLKLEQEQEQQNQKFLQLDAQLQQQIASIGQQSFSQKMQALQTEVAARRAKINTEISDERKKQILLNQLSRYEAEQTRALAKFEVETKQAAMFTILESAAQTLSILNSMNQSGTKAEIARARAILALEKSIAIARAIAEAQKGGPMAAGIAAANIALITAQFAQQSNAIGQAASAFGAGQSQVSLSTPLPGGGNLEQIFGGNNGGGGGGNDLVRAFGGGGSGGGSGGGGGGGPTIIINVGGINANFNIDKLSIENANAIFRTIYEGLRRGTIEGTLASVEMVKTGNNNSGLAT